MKRYSFFDFDGTLTRKDTLPLFMRHAIGLPRTIAAFLRAMPAIAAWKLKRITNSEAKERLFSFGFKGMKVEEFREKGRTFAEKVRGIERPETVKALREAAARGDNTAIVSASMGSWIRPWAEGLDFIRVISTEPEVKRGRLTGRFATPNCHGPESVGDYWKHSLNSTPTAAIAMWRHGVTVRAMTRCSRWQMLATKSD